MLRRVNAAEINAVRADTVRTFEGNAAVYQAVVNKTVASFQFVKETAHPNNVCI